MSSNIEDLLTMDSDNEEEFSSNIDLKDMDLEHILSMKEDEDDDDHHEPKNKSFIAPTKVSSIPNPTSKITKLFDRETSLESLNPTTEINKFKKNIQDLISDDEDEDEAILPSKDNKNQDNTNLETMIKTLSSEQLSLEDFEEQELNSSETILMTTSTTSNGCESLRLAEQREQRIFTNPDKSLITTLQIRKNAGTSAQTFMTNIEELNTITGQLKRNGNYQQHGPGIATALCVCSKYIAIGTMKGYIILFDHKQEIRRVFTSPIPTKGVAMAVVSMDCLSDGSMIVTGHRCGEIFFWDTIKGITIKQIKDPSNSELLSLSFLPNISQSDVKCTYSLAESDSFHIITHSTNHIINRIKLSKSLLTAWHVDIDCFLDEHNVSKVYSLAILRPCEENGPLRASESSSSQSMDESMFNDYCKIATMLQYFAFSFAKQTCIVQTSPELKIIYKWDSDQNLEELSSAEGDISMTKADEEVLEWSWISSQNKWTPILTRGRATTIEILMMKIFEQPKPVTQPTRHSSLLRFTPFLGTEDIPILKYEFIVLSTAKLPEGAGIIRGIKWINHSQLIIFTSTDSYLYDNELKLLETCQLPTSLSSIYQLPPTPSNQEINPMLTLFNKEIHILLSTQYFRTSIKSPFDQANGFINNGRWLEGLAMIVESIQKAPSLLLLEEESIKRYILNYALLAVKRTFNEANTNNNSHNHTLVNTPHNQSSHNMSTISSKNRFDLVASVCVEYCVNTSNLPLLFYEILEIFKHENQQKALFEALEPFILNGTIKTLPLLVTIDFLTTAIQYQNTKLIERCIVYFDPYSLDLNFVTRFLYDHHMYSSFLYIYAYGLNDFNTPFQLVFHSMVTDYIEKNMDQQLSLTSPSEQDYSLHSNLLMAEQAEIGYKLLLYLSYTFDDRIFPRGESLVQNITTIWNLLKLLTNSSWEEIQPIFTKQSSSQGQGQTQQQTPEQLAWEYAANSATASLTKISYPYLTYLAKLDAIALFHVVTKGIYKLESILLSLRPSQTNPEEEDYTITSKQTGEIKLVYILLQMFLFTQAYDNTLVTSTPQDTPALLHHHIGTSMQSLFFECFYDLLPTISGDLSTKLLIQLIHSMSEKPHETRAISEAYLIRVFTKQLIYLTDVTRLHMIKACLFEHQFYWTYISILNMLFSSSNFIPSSLSYTLNDYFTVSDDLEMMMNVYIDYAKDIRNSQEYMNNLNTNNTSSYNLQKPNDQPSPQQTQSENNVTTDLIFLFIDQLFLLFNNEKIIIVSNKSSNTTTSTSNNSTNKPTNLSIIFRQLVFTNLLELSNLQMSSTIHLIIKYLLLQMDDLMEYTKSNLKEQFSLLQTLFQQLKQMNNLNNNSLTNPQSDLFGSNPLNITNPPNNPTINTTINNTMTTTPMTIREIFSIKHFQYYLMLLCKFTNAKQLLTFVQEYIDCLQIDECIQLMKEYRHHDVLSYLLERTGDYYKAFQILLQELSLLIKVSRKDIDHQLSKEMKDSTNLRRSLMLTTSSTGKISSSSSGSMLYLSQLLSHPHLIHELSEKISSCQALQHIVHCITSFCERQQHQQITVTQVPTNQSTPRTNNTTTPRSLTSSPSPNSYQDNRQLTPEDLWCWALDTLLKERHGLKEGKISTSGEILSQYLSYLLQEFMTIMKNFIPPKDIIGQILKHACSTGLKLVEFKEIMMNMLEVNRYELLINETLYAICKHDLHLVHQKSFQQKRAFVHRHDPNTLDIQQLLEPSNNSLSDGTKSPLPSSSLFVPTKQSRGVRYFQSKDFHAMNQQFIDRSLSYQPRTTLPPSMVDFSMFDAEPRNPGSLDLKPNFSVSIPEYENWQ